MAHVKVDFREHVRPLYITGIFRTSGEMTPTRPSPEVDAFSAMSSRLAPSQSDGDRIWVTL